MLHRRNITKERNKSRQQLVAVDAKVYLCTEFDPLTKPPTGMERPLTRIVTLDEFIMRSQKEHSAATGELTGLLRDIGVAAKIVNREVNKAGLVNILGVDGAQNLSGDIVQKLISMRMTN